MERTPLLCRSAVVRGSGPRGSSRITEQPPSSYFIPHHIEGAGTFQDGGLTFNNPASIAVKEAEALFPLVPGPGSTERRENDTLRFAAAWEDSYPA